MFSETIILRAFVVLLLIARTIYWRIEEAKAYSAKPMTQHRTSFIKSHIIVRNLMNIFVFAQLLGLSILSFNKNLVTEMIGAVICILAFICSILARYALGVNWTDSAESQIKEKHSVVTSGIYKYIRHPIAVGYCFFIIGVELLVGSLLVIPVAIGLFVGAYIQSRIEEALLIQQFGKEYKDYMKNTKMFIPYIW